jgi:hypothetical protein
MTSRTSTNFCVRAGGATADAGSVWLNRHLRLAEGKTKREITLRCNTVVVALAFCSKQMSADRRPTRLVWTISARAGRRVARRPLQKAKALRLTLAGFVVHRKAPFWLI